MADCFSQPTIADLLLPMHRALVYFAAFLHIIHSVFLEYIMRQIGKQLSSFGIQLSSEGGSSHLSSEPFSLWAQSNQVTSFGTVAPCSLSDMRGPVAVLVSLADVCLEMEELQHRPQPPIEETDQKKPTQRGYSKQRGDGYEALHPILNQKGSLLFFIHPF